MFRIAIASGKGGTGKTFVATNIFYSFSKRKRMGMLVDCDAEAPNSAAFFNAEPVEEFAVTQLIPVIDKEKCTFCGRCHEFCNFNAIFILPPAKIINVMEDLCHGCGACSVACEENAISEHPSHLGVITRFSLNETSAEILEARINIGVLSPVPVIKAALKRINGNQDIVILDSPPGTSCPFIQTVAQADYIILVTEPTPFGLSDLKQSAETLRIMDKPFGVIINRAGLGDNNVNHYLQNEKIPLLLEIPFKKEIAELYSVGKIVAETDPVFSEQLIEMVGNIINENGDSNNKR
jgi:MinD superfamily P-loop ATPase